MSIIEENSYPVLLQAPTFLPIKKETRESITFINSTQESPGHM